MLGDRLYLLSLCTVCLWGMLAAENLAQTTPDNSLGNENSVLNENVTAGDRTLDLIEGGAVRGKNLFHSFSEFNIPETRQVYFANPKGIDRILTRVTGNDVSEILGTLGVDGTADLFILNSNGIVFGENASLDLAGSFLATTAESFWFKDDIVYGAIDPQIPPLLNLKIPIGLQFGSTTSKIEVRGTGHQSHIDTSTSTLLPILDSRPSGLEVAAGETLALIGNRIDLKGGNLTTSEGKIELAAIESSGRVEFESKNKALAFNYDRIDTLGKIDLSEASSLYLLSDKKGEIQLQGQNITLRDGSAIIADKFGSGKQAQISLTASDSLNMVGDSTGFPSAIISNAKLQRGKPFSRDQLSQTEAVSPQSNIDLNIETTSLNLQNNAAIATIAKGKSNGGNINVVAQDIDLIADSESTANTGIFSQVSSSATGNGGEIIIEVENLRLLDNGQTIEQIDDDDDLKALIGKKRADRLEDFLEDNEDIIVEDKLVLQNGGQIAASSEGQGDSGVILINTDRVRLLDLSLPEPIEEKVEVTDTVNKPQPVPEVPDTVDKPQPELDREEVEVSINTIENLLSDEMDFEVRQPKTDDAKNSSTAVYVFELDNGKNLVINAEELTRVGEQSVISNSTNDASNNESETVKIFINGLLTPKTFDKNFDLTPVCRVEDSNFINIGRGGLPENPLNGIVENTVLPDLEMSQTTESTVTSSSAEVILPIPQAIVEAQSWKIGRNGKVVELVATSSQSNLTRIFHSCSGDR